MKIKDILLENKLSSDEIINHLRVGFSNAITQYKKGFVIYKGSKTFSSGQILTPIENRRSIGIPNIYNPIINSAPWWSGYPDRNVICTTHQRYASAYGEVFVVLPKNGSVIGVSPTGDIYSSKFFNSQDYLLPVFSRDVGDILGFMGGFDNYDTLVKEISLFDNLKKDEKNKILQEDGIKMPEQYKNEIIVYGLFEFIKKYINPRDFRSTKIESFDEKNNREVWFDSDFIVLSPEDMNHFIELI